MFGVGVGEGEGMMGVFWRRAGLQKVLVFELRAVAATAAERVDGFRDCGIDAGVEGVEVGVGVGGGDVGEGLETG